MDELIQEAIDKKKIYQEDGERIQKNIDAVNFVSPRGREQAIISCIKHMAIAKRHILLAIREDKRARGLLKPKVVFSQKEVQKR